MFSSKHGSCSTSAIHNFSFALVTFGAMRSLTHSELILPARKIEFESCKKMKKKGQILNFRRKDGGIIRPKRIVFRNSLGKFIWRIWVSNILQKKEEFCFTSFHLSLHFLFDFPFRLLSSFSSCLFIFSFIFSLLFIVSLLFSFLSLLVLSLLFSRSSLLFSFIFSLFFAFLSCLVLSLLFHLLSHLFLSSSNSSSLPFSFIYLLSFLCVLVLSCLVSPLSSSLAFWSYLVFSYLVLFCLLLSPLLLSLPCRLLLSLSVPVVFLCLSLSPCDVVCCVM